MRMYRIVEGVIPSALSPRSALKPTVPFLLASQECEDIFNSEEICEAVEMVTNMHCKHYT